MILRFGQVYVSEELKGLQLAGLERKGVIKKPTQTEAKPRFVKPTVRQL